MRRHRSAAALATVFSLATAPVVRGQQPAYPTQWSPAIAQRADVKAALAFIDQGFTKQVDEWVHITEIQAKSTHEQERAAYVRDVMRAEGLAVSIDSIGNVTGRRAGTGGGPTIVFAAHMDIVHPLGTNLTVRRDGDTLRAPGVFDNSASVANLLAVIRAMRAANVRTKANFAFVATVQEELGLNGMDWWLDHNPKPDLLVGMDGGFGPINYGALGIYWSKYVFTGEGSHTVTSRGKPTPVKAVADAIDHLYRLNPPPLPQGAVYNVGQIHGGAIFNGTPQELYFTMDLRSPNPVLLDSLDRAIDAIADAAAKKEGVKWHKEVVLHNKAGGTTEMLAGARAHPIVQTAIDIHRYLGIDIGPPGKDAEAYGSTDANMGVVRGIPSIAVGRSWGGNQHTLTEWAHWPSALPATKMILLLAVSLSDGARSNAVVP
ncbi:MAG: M20/M25/M40 family metallo-hydrolase [Gemmatimonadetes bacterium]|nr:M20/M25/M40 family metallo-hydrolase [Gemmatimonadota bacterium]MBI3504445.1 M20/M25/M40 family metallo-hydrolase [Pseudomonadota bacterium]